MAGSENGTSGSADTSSRTAPRRTLWGYVSQDILITALFTLRVGTIFSSFIYVISSLGFFGHIMYTAYLNAMMTAFLTFVLRLYRRKSDNHISLVSREMYNLLTTEDSSHYMFYTVFFYNQQPAPIYLLPPLLYAIVFTHTYTEGMKQFLPQLIQNLLTRLNEKIKTGQRDVFRFIAYTEIFVFLVILWNVFSGYMFFLAPLVYYYFLKSRYLSRRNHYVRTCFSELRFAAQQMSNSPRCPSFLSSAISGLVSFISQLAPIEQIPRQA